MRRSANLATGWPNEKMVGWILRCWLMKFSIDGKTSVEGASGLHIGINRPPMVLSEYND